MPDYREMYGILFHEMTKAISVLQNAQQQTEEMYINDGNTDGLIDLNQTSDDSKRKTLRESK